MVFRVIINTENEAFEPYPYPEVARILREIADRLNTVVSSGDSMNRHDYGDSRKGWVGHYQTIFDINGNDVGRYAFKPK